jgi:signal transduction histidine kinase/DNA-binding response OmpR family regulator
MQIKLALFLFLLFVSSTTAFANNNLNFDKLADSQIKSNDAPVKVHKSQFGELWLLYDNYLVKKAGADTKTWWLKDLVKQSELRQSEYQVVEAKDSIYITYSNLVLHYSFNTKAISVLNLDIQIPDVITGAAVLDENYLIVSTFDKLIKVSTLDHSFSQVSLPRDLSGEFSSPLYLAVQSDQQGGFVFTTFASGLFHFTASGDLSSISTIFDAKNQINVFRRLNESMVGIAAQSGFYVLSNDLKKVTKVELEGIDNVSKINVDGSGKIWLSNTRKLGYLDKTLSKFIPVSVGLTKQSPKAVVISDVFIDDENIIWLSVYREGIYSYSQYRHKFTRLVLPDLPQLDSLSFVDVQEDGSYIISGSDSAYISEWNQNIDFGVSASIQEADSYWLGAKGKLIHIKKSRAIEEFNLSSSEKNSKVISLYLSKDNRLWVVSARSGLHVLNLNSKEYESLPISFSDRIAQQIIRIIPHPRLDHKLVIVTKRSILEYDLDTQNLITLVAQYPESMILKALSISGNKLLISLPNDSIFNFDLVDYSAKHWKTSLQNIGCAMSSPDGEIWVTEIGGGVSSVRKSNNELRVFDSKDGIPKTGFSGRLCFEFKNQVVFGSRSGLYKYEPENDFKNKEKPITRINYITNKKEKWTSVPSSGIKLTEQSFPITMSIFNGSFANSEKNQYQYKIVGSKNANWRNIENATQYFSIENLVPADYRILLRSSNNDLIWSHSVAVKLEVNPPIYLSWWAKLSYLVIFIALMFTLYRKRIALIEARATELESQVKHRTKELDHEKKNVERLLSFKEQELVNVSHELRTPITLISGPLKSAVEKTSDLKIKPKLEMAYRNSQRLSRMVDQLLHLDKFRLQRTIAMQAQPVDKFVEFIVDSFQVPAQKKKITLELITNVVCNMNFVPDAFEKILINLLSNAIKYSSQGGRIIVTTSYDQFGNYQVKVKDNGKGIAPEHIPHLFEQFYRVHDEDSEKVTGAGVGLALVKELVEHHNGHIIVTSEHGVGSEFSAIFPADLVVEASDVSEHVNQEQIAIELEELGSSTNTIQTKEQEQLEANKTTILLIEDNPDMQQYIVDVLTPDFQCIVRENGQLGVDAATRFVPDLIISDVMMPVMDGYQATRVIKEDIRTSHVPVLMLTARGDKDSRLEGWKALADEYLAKPFDEEELLLRVNNLLSIRTLIRQRFAQAIRDDIPLKQELVETIGEKDAEFMDRINALIEKNYTNSEFNIDELASQIYMSIRQMQRKLKSLVEYAPSEYLRIYRLNKAKQLINAGTKISDVYLQTGFASHTYFGRCFKAHFNLTPSEYQQSVNR